MRFWKNRRKIVIGIHGVGNKPPERILKHWWERSIREGLKRIGHGDQLFDFELVYWARYLYPEPQKLQFKDKSHPLHIDDPYMPGPSTGTKRAPSRVRKKALNLIEKILDKVFLSERKLFSFDPIADFIIQKKFRDLDLYYQNATIDWAGPDYQARVLIRHALAQTLRKHRKDNIMLIAHSMGSIVAYDVLTQEVPGVSIHTFVTLGSPLGLPAIMKRILRQMHQDPGILKKAPTPENIRHAWYNVSDLNDTIAVNYSLADDFAKNPLGVGPQDIIVNNDYEFEGERNHHKSYGYLRTTEVAEVIYQFLLEKEPTLYERLKRFSIPLFRSA
ncbi:MAG TPA: hypothetical protein VGA99_04905 [bacterium]